MTDVDQIRLSVIVPFFNHWKMTLKCINELCRGAADVDMEILLINDCSTELIDESELHDCVTIIENENNLGWLKSCNMAASRAKGDYLLFQNNDCFFDGSQLANFISLFTKLDAGILAPTLTTEDGTLQDAGVRISPSGHSRLIGIGNPPATSWSKDYREVNFVSGACFLIKSDLWHALEGFDEIYDFGYYEDTELCLRVRETGRKIYVSDTIRAKHLMSVTTASVSNEKKLKHLHLNRHTFLTRWSENLISQSDLKTLCFYLPQFHQIDENDLWWGKGFTEWSNVASAKPLFEGHNQPRIPADLGFYDLTNEEHLSKQIKIARKYDISGFVIYYYSFQGRRVLEKPLNLIANADNNINFPFCLCWANEPWSRRWDGNDHEVLMRQQYSDATLNSTIKEFIDYSRSENYITINGKPLIIIYRHSDIDCPNFAEKVRDAFWHAKRQEVYLAYVESFEHALIDQDPLDHGFDASIEFPPHGLDLPIQDRTAVPDFTGKIFSFADVVEYYCNMPRSKYQRYRGLMLGWDNTARASGKNNTRIFDGFSPALFQSWVETAVQQTMDRFVGDERLIFVNAWNEWAEGTYLEPDRKWGHQNLVAFKNGARLAREYDPYD